MHAKKNPSAQVQGHRGVLAAVHTLCGGSGIISRMQNPRERRPHPAHRVVHRARTARAFLATLFYIFQVFFRVARTRWPKGYTYNNGGLHSSLLTKGGCSCPHPLPGEGRRKRKKKM